MRIGTAAKTAGVSVETVRFYERQGLIGQPSRPIDGGYRSYPSETVGRIRFIRQAQDLGFALKEIEELLSLRADPSTDCADVRARASMKLEDMKVTRLHPGGENSLCKTNDHPSHKLSKCPSAKFLSRLNRL